jgi:hypothetical protein
MVGAAAITTAGALYTANKGRQAARAAAGAAGESSGYYNTLAEISADQYELWKKDGLPLLQELSGFRKSNLAEEEGLAADAVRTQYAAGRDRTKRALETFRNPGDPGYADILANTYGAEASDVASAITTSRRAALDRDYARTNNLLNVYRGMPGQAMQGYSAAGAGQLGVGKLQGGIADMYSGWGAQAGYAAGNIFGRMGRSAGGGGADGGGGFDMSQYDHSQNYAPEGNNLDMSQNAMAEGGKIKGPGTGTSDSVSAIKRPGTYILSADTVRSIGTKKLNDMIENAGVRPGQGGENDKGGVPVRLSNGEFSMPPEVTAYFGEDFFNKLQQKYHRPVFSDEGGAANGGAIRRRVLPRRVEEAIFRSMPDEALMRR